jgi:hypothetical protein
MVMSSTQEKLEEIWKKEFGDSRNPPMPEDLLSDLLRLIDSAKREAYKQGYIDAGIDIINRQAKESKLSACCGAEITETGFCTDCKDNC